MKIQLNITLLNVVGKHMAMTELGGIRIRGKRAPEPADAVRNLLWKLSGADQDDEAEVAIELAVAGTSIEKQLALGDGEKSE